jgi:cysteine-rich repeat protein
MNTSVANNNFNSFCSEICGDGKRFILQCDDGNTINGDGCSNTCTIESSWICSGGSSTSKDTCTLSTSKITLLKNVIFGNALYQNVFLTPLPKNLTANGCPNCPNLINATLYSAPSGAIVNSNFIPNTEYNYVLTAIIPNATNLTGILVLGVSLNQNYSAYFSASEMSQIQFLTVNLSSVPVLATTNNVVTA